jgi:hypothetical protein
VSSLQTIDAGALFQPYVDEFVSFDLGGGLTQARIDLSDDVTVDGQRSFTHESTTKFGYWMGGGMEFYFQVHPKWWMPKGIRLQMEYQAIPSVGLPTVAFEPAYNVNVTFIRSRNYVFWTF